MAVPQTAPPAIATPAHAPSLSRQLGLFDATMVVMGGIIGTGIFMNPAVVARAIPAPLLMLAAWLTGGVLALIGAFIWAELASQIPVTGGTYAYLRESYHPLVAFLYGWVTLLVIQTGGMAAVALTFSRYFLELTGGRGSEAAVAVGALTLLTTVNCLGVKQGATVQSTLTVLKIGAVAVVVVCGLALVHTQTDILGYRINRPPLRVLSDFGSALVAVMFAYGGWETSTFVSGELKNPRRDMPRALVAGVCGVIFLYLLVGFVYVRALGGEGLAASTAPASGVMQLALGRTGAIIIAAGISISTLGFLSQNVLTGPRVYFAMSEDGVFFPAMGRVNPRTRVPMIAIIVQSIWTIVLAMSGKYEQMLAYVVSMDVIFWGLVGTCVFILRRRKGTLPDVRVPVHPFSTIVFVGVCWAIMLNTLYRFPKNALIACGLLALGVPVFFFWRARLRRATHVAARRA
jgi:APA family basic amino acid/polyamine antiporter